MKKKYINPETTVAKVENTSIMQASPTGFNGGLNTTGANGSAALGKERDEEDTEETGWSDGLW